MKGDLEVMVVDGFRVLNASGRDCGNFDTYRRAEISRLRLEKLFPAGAPFRIVPAKVEVYRRIS